MTTCKSFAPGKPDPRAPHVRFDAGNAVSIRLRRGVSLGRFVGVFAALAAAGSVGAVCVTVDPARVEAKVSANIYGLGMEDVNHEIYGGLDAQRLYGESFEEMPKPKPWDGIGLPKNARAHVSCCWESLGGSLGEILYDTSVAHWGRASQALKPNGSMTRLYNSGLGNAGIPVRKGRALVGHVYVRGSVSALEVTMMAKTGNRCLTDTVLLAPAPGDAWRKAEFRLVPTDDDPAARFAIIAQGYGTVWIDDAYLADEPTNAFGRIGCREDVVAGLQEVGVNFLRWGGSMCNAEDYNLKAFDGTRKPYRGFWHANSSGGFGPREFVRLAATMNVPCAVSIAAREDVADAVKFAEDLKRYDIPIVVEIGNEELIGNVTAPAAMRQYCDFVRTLVPAMRKANPKLRFATALWWHNGRTPCDEAAFGLLDGVVEYWDLHPGFQKPQEAIARRGVVREFMKKIRQWNPKTTMRVAVFEENGSRHDMSRALCHALMLEEVRAAGEDILTSCPANAFQVWHQNDNGWDQGNVFITPDKVWLAPCGWAQRMARDGHRELLIASESSDADVHVSAVRDRDDQSVVLHLVNISEREKPIELAFRNAPVRTVTRAVELAGAEGLQATNTPEATEHVKPVDITTAAQRGLVLKPYSYTVVTLGK